MKYYTLYPPELYHHGVLGQKWGVRRYQNYDGTRIGKSNRLEKRHIKSTNLTIQELDKPFTAKIIGRVNKHVQEEMNKTMDAKIIHNDKKIGDLELYEVSPNELNVVWLGINEKERGKGYATSIMDDVKVYAKEKGYNKISLEVPGTSPDARHIYEKAGFKTKKKISSDDIWGGLTVMEYKIK